MQQFSLWQASKNTQWISNIEQGISNNEVRNSDNNFCFSRPSLFSCNVRHSVVDFKFQIWDSTQQPPAKMRIAGQKTSDSEKSGLPASLLDIPCSILDIRSQSCAGPEGGNLPLIGYSCLPACHNENCCIELQWLLCWLLRCLWLRRESKTSRAGRSAFFPFLAQNENCWSNLLKHSKTLR